MKTFNESLPFTLPTPYHAGLDCLCNSEGQSFMNQDEIWKDVVGHEGKYRVSNYGRVYSVCVGRIKSIYIDRRGYYRTQMYGACSHSKNFTVHRLVALAFIPNADNKPHVNHINNISTDNRVENLEWCTNRENQIHAANFRLATGQGRPKWGKFKIELYSNGSLVGVFDSISDASKKVNVSRKTACLILRGRKESCKGYVFKIAQ